MEGKYLFSILFVPILFSTGVPWWFDPLGESLHENGFNRDKVFFVVAGDLYFWIGIILGSMAFLIIIYLYFRTHRSMIMKKVIHDIVHFSRDQQSLAYQSDKEGEFPGIKHLSNHLCSKLQEYFRVQVPMAKPLVAIRLFNNDEYITVGRSEGFSRGRVDTTTPLLRTDGLAKLLASKKTNGGVFIIFDLEKAAETGAYKVLPNDEIYRKDYNTMMVAPINGWDGEKISLLGMLFVTSKRRNVFKEKHVDCAAFAADTCASIYCTVVNQIDTGNQATTNTGELE